MLQKPNDKAAELTKQTAGLSTIEILQRLASDYPGAVTFSTSFSNEDQIITYLIAQSRSDISLFTLDTGRLFQTTYNVWQDTLAALNVSIKGYYPDTESIHNFTLEHGPNAFYQSVDLRKQCCHIRKVVPLKKALKNKSVWITGLRTEHSTSRSELNQFEWDEENNLVKFHPLLHWRTNEITAFLKQYNLPYNPLTEKGFVSIGCEPCTRAILPGEDFRAGRWWWEEANKKECGLHVHPITREEINQ